MRVSIEKTDSGYDEYVYKRAMGFHVKVLLDGFEQKECLTADDELGYVLKASLPLRAVNDLIVTEEAYGQVEIIDVPV